MIELQIVPVAVVVAGGTVFCRVCRSKLTAVGIGMARRTIVVSNFEHRESCPIGCFFFRMTGNTRLGKMRPDQREFGLLVIGHGKERRRKTMLIVTGGTDAAVGSIGKLPAMHIGMAVGTLVVRDRSGHATVFVARLAFQSGVQADQWKLRLAMIEIGHGNIVPATRPVTAGAIQPKFALMLVFVTVGAVLEFQVGVPAIRHRLLPALIGHQRMALRTIDRAMFPSQDETCAVVTEMRNRLKPVVGVAF